MRSFSCLQVAFHAGHLVIAFLVAGLVVLFVGESPFKAAYLMVSGAFGSGEGIGYTLFYATNFIFAGLAVAVAFHAGLFNIGVEGQAYIGGIGVAIAWQGLRAIIAGAGVWKMRELVGADAIVFDPLVLLAGVTASAISGLLAIWLLLRYLRNHGLKVFVYYRIVFGIIVIALAVLFRFSGE